jgi:YfiH family protein
MLHFFTKHKDVQAMLSLAKAGNMKLRDNSEDVQTIENQKTFLEEQGINFDAFSYAYVVHGTNVEVVDENAHKRYRNVDALVTKAKGKFIGITVADCFPVYFYDAKNEICGVAHAGWRGIVKEIIPATIEKMIEIGAESDYIHIELGPGISQANFEFHFSEMIQEFGQYNQDKYVKPGSSLDKINIDLQAILIDQIEETGVPAKNVEYCAECTFADEKFFSARRHQGDSHSAMLAVIGMK